MALLAFVFVLFLFFLIIVGLAVQLYLYSHGAFGKKQSEVIPRSFPNMEAAILERTAVMPVSDVLLSFPNRIALV
jgi:hypothetical protein